MIRADSAPWDYKFSYTSNRNAAARSFIIYVLGYDAQGYDGARGIRLANALRGQQPEKYIAWLATRRLTNG